MKKHLIQILLNEDSIHDDITTQSFIDKNQQVCAQIILKEKALFFGHQLAQDCVQYISHQASYHPCSKEGVWLEEKSIIAEIKMGLIDLMKLERSLLNCLQRLSGVATLTRCMVEKIGDLSIEILGTRKTSPFLREDEVLAIESAGARMHRVDLSSSILIKENHIYGYMKENNILTKEEALREMLSTNHSTQHKVAVEVNSISEAEQLYHRNVDVILCDNMAVEDVKKIIQELKKQSISMIVEVSGNICFENMNQWLFEGVNRISSGALTHSAIPVDLSLIVI